MDNKSLTIFIIGLLLLLTVYFLVFWNKSVHQEQFKEGTYKIIYIYSETCPYCVSFTPIFEQYKATESYNKKLHFIDLEKKDASEYLSEVSGFPSVLIVDDTGKIVGKQVGKTTMKDLDSFVKKFTT